jgi:hypothetical protein
MTSHPTSGGFCFCHHNFRKSSHQTGWLFYYEDNMNDKMNKEKILKTIRRSAKKLHRNPTLRDLAEAGISRHVLVDRCGSLGKALATVGLKAIGAGVPHTDSTLLLD